ncbi:MAG TPA: hypothetical protein VFV68_08180 [Agriterribacter sp.]|nr:hypothetical protein [Agriterribacter sp.]
MKSKRASISFGALVALVGFVLSGPLGFLLVQITKPQPAWTSPEIFVSHYHFIQNVPYYFGFILVGGMLILSAAHYINADQENAFDQLQILLSLVFTIIFATFILSNYICQTTFIHHLASNYKSEYNNTISTFTMANPDSVSWSIEMWGYGMLGIATWLLSAFYKEKSRVIYKVLIINGIVSLLSAVLYTIDAGWLLTTTGIVSYFVWNLLMIVLLVLVYRHSKYRKMTIKYSKQRQFWIDKQSKMS